MSSPIEPDAIQKPRLGKRGPTEALRDEQKEEFIRQYGELLTVTEAAHAIGKHPSTIYRWFEKDEAFYALVLEVRREIKDALLSVAMEAGLSGEDLVTTRWLLSKLSPEEFGDATQVTNKQDGEVKFVLEYEDEKVPQLESPEGEE